MFTAKGFAAALLVAWCCSLHANDSALILEYQREFSMLEEADNSVDLRLYSDGTVEVHYPIFMRRAGDYRFQLETDELQSTLTDLRQLGLDTFEAGTARRELAMARASAMTAAQTGNGSVYTITDPDITHLRFAPSLDGSSDGSELRYSFAGVQNHAQIYPQLTAIGDLAAALDILDGLTTDNRMEVIQ